VERKVGVDPYSGGNFRGTSDEFFSKNNEKFDCIFIDGLHEYEQVCRDISNSLKILNKNGIILLHDCLPSTIHQQAVPRYKAVWNGDVWKSIVNFRTNPNIDTVTCRIDHGISIIRNVKNLNVLNIDCANFKKLKFKDFYYNHQEYMRIMNFEELIKYIQD
jgi:predicted O-methyltransferase YrrM